MKWIEATVNKLDDRTLPNMIEALQAEQTSFKSYRADEKPPKFKEKDSLEAKLFKIQTKLRTQNRTLYRPPEGRLIADVNKAWSVLESAEHDRQVVLVEELKRLSKLEQVGLITNRCCFILKMSFFFLCSLRLALTKRPKSRKPG